MKLKELSHTTLLMKLNISFCCDWSEDNKFFVITSEGLDVFHLKPNPQSKQGEIHFNRSFIFPVVYYPTEHAEFNESIVGDLSREDLSLLLCEPLLVPRLGFTCNVPIYFIQAMWSPAKIVPNKNCILALLTSVGGTTLWIYKTNTWEVLSDISNFVMLYLKKNNALDKIQLPTSKYMSEFRNRCHKLATSCVAWSVLYKTEEWIIIFFICIQKNGDVYIWRISPNDYLDLSLSTNLEILCESNYKNVSFAHWSSLSPSKAILLLGTTQGKVHNLYFNLDKSYKLTYEGAEDIWADEDCLKVSLITSTDWDGIQKCIILIKGTFFIVSLINEEGKVLNTIHKHLDNLNITSFKELCDKEYTVSTLTGAIFILKLIPNSSGNPDIIVSRLESDVSYDGWTQQGVCTSKNNAIWVKCLNPCKITSKILGKTSSRLAFSHVEDVDPMQIILNNRLEMLTDHWDLMEVARVRMIKDKNFPESWITNISDASPPYHVKVYLWTSIMKLSTKETVQNIREIVLRNHVISYLQKMLIDHAERRDRNEFDSITLSLQLKYLKYRNRTIDKGKYDTLISTVERELGGIIIPDAESRCEWCDEALENTACSQNHPRQWCCVTLQGLTDERSLICTLCGCSAHTDLLDGAQTCTFCDSYLQCNSLFVKKGQNVEKIIED